MIVGGVLIGLMPWAYGGRNATWLLLTAFALVISTVLLSRGQSRQAVASRPLAVATIAWITWGVLSLTWSVNRYQTAIWLLYALLAVATFTLSASLKRDQKRLLVAGYVLSAAATAIIGLIFFFTGDYERLTATFYWANPAAAYLLPALLIVGSKALPPSTKLQPSRQLQATILTLLIATAFWLADSRGASLVLLLCLAAVLIIPAVRRYWKRILALLLGSFVLAWSAAALKPALHTGGTVITPGSRYSAAAQSESSSLSQRVDYLTSATAAWWQRPFVGHGAGTFATVHPQFQQKVVSATNDAHNYYLQTLVEQGVVGAGLLGWVVFLLLVGLAIGIQRDRTKLAWALGALALLLHFGLDIDTRYPALILLLAALLGLVYQPLKTAKPGRYRIWLLPATLLAVVVLALSNYQSSVWQAKGDVLNDQHDLSAAASAFNKAHQGLVYDPDTYTAEGIDYFVLASITSGSKQYQAMALERANSAIKLDPHDAQHYFLRGRVQRLAGNLPAAQADIEHALKLDRFNHADYYADLISIQLQRGDFNGAGRSVDAALNLYTDAVIANRSADNTIKSATASILSMRASHLESIGDKAGANAAIERALRLDPSNSDAARVKAALN